MSERQEGMFARYALVVVTVACGLFVASCSKLTEPTDVLKTYRSVWINASWTGGRTGPPLNVKTDGPGSFSGSYCPPSALILENHSTRFKNIWSWADQTLVFKNTCTAPVEMAACVSAGTGGNSSEFPVCNTDPRTTPLSRLDTRTRSARPAIRTRE